MRDVQVVIKFKTDASEAEVEEITTDMVAQLETLMDGDPDRGIQVRRVEAVSVERREVR